MEKTIEYLRALIAEEDGELAALRTAQEEKGIPIIRKEVQQLLTVLIMAKGARRILELGGAEGYSAICFARAAGENADITTVEIDEARVLLARENIETFGLAERITVIADSAQGFLAHAAEKEVYDIIFLDGPKSHYAEMLEDCLRLLKRGGLLVADNILYFGMVSGEVGVKTKRRTSVEGLKRYLNAVTSDERLVTSVINFEDGLSISYKKE